MAKQEKTKKNQNKSEDEKCLRLWNQYKKICAELNDLEKDVQLLRERAQKLADRQALKKTLEKIISQ